MSTWENYDAMLNEYYAVRSGYRQKLRDALELDLKDAGLYDIDIVDRDTAQIGRLKVIPVENSPIKQEIRFFPYKADSKQFKSSKKVDPYRELSDRFKFLYKGGKA